MNCPRRHPTCRPLIINRQGKDFICRGINRNPKKYRHDRVGFCVEGQYVKGFRMELTKGEARIIGAVLGYEVNK